ncbi:pol protein [Cucumis melo var. makuwa]|uniref:Pol protein n=1 Tax=Cucumis melo var. makuwa TaxID=1194695 RepID=A0A5D3DV03_CUCMM|nr:pol protein [Cucumis melo var. makuwa]
MRQRRWLELVKDYDCEILYHPGKANVAPLHRDLERAEIAVSVGAVTMLLAQLTVQPTLRQRIIDAQRNDPYLVEKRGIAEVGQAVEISIYSDGGLLFERRLCVPSNSANLLVDAWCVSRLRHQGRKPAGLLQPLSIPEWKWENVSMDFITGLPRTLRGFTVIWVVVDRLTKSAHFVPGKSAYTASKWAQLYMSEIVRLHGVPVSIVSDRDARFTSKFWKGLQTAMGTRLDFSTAFHPQTDGQTERLNQVLEDMLRACALEFPGSWDSHLHLMEFAYNNSYQATIGMAPFEALYRKCCRSPVCWGEVGEQRLMGPELIQSTNEAIQKIRSRMQTVQSRQKSYANVRWKDLEFDVGDKVFLKVAPMKGVLRFERRGKLSPRFVRPFEILEQIGPVAYRLALPPSLSTVHDVFHVSMLRKYVPDPSHVVDYEPLEIDENLSYTEQPVEVLAREVDPLSVDSIGGHNQVSGKGFPTTEPRIEARNVVIHRGLHVTRPLVVACVPSGVRSCLRIDPDAGCSVRVQQGADRREAGMMRIVFEALVTSGNLGRYKYDAEFDMLSRFPPKMIATEAARADKFVRGLRLDIQGFVGAFQPATHADALRLAVDFSLQERANSSKVAGGEFRRFQQKPFEAGEAARGKSLCTTCGKHHLGRCLFRTRICFKCRQEGHTVDTCPMRLTENVQNQGAGAPHQGTIFATNKTDAERAGTVVTGTLPVLGHYALVLFDSGSSHSFIFSAFVLHACLEVEPLHHVLSVSTPSGECMLSMEKVKACQIEIAGHVFEVTLLVLDMLDFDVILGMDWLVANHASIDCSRKEVAFNPPSIASFKFKGEGSRSLPKVISAMRSNKLLSQGTWNILASVVDTREVDVSLSSEPVVRDYPDVFSEELPGLPPHIEIEFAIELESGTVPISRAPYRMAPAELKELKVQLQELLDKGFIRPSVSPWGAPILFVKKKDGSMRLCIDYR